jgi:hypothetical protein
MRGTKAMATTLEERVSALEAQVANLLAEKKEPNAQVVWYERWKGAFQDDEIYDEAMRLGAEYRRSQPTAAEEIEALEKAGVHVPLPDGQ